MKLTSTPSALISLHPSLLTRDFQNFQVFVRSTNAGSSGASDASHGWRTDYLLQLPVGLTLRPQPHQGLPHLLPGLHCSGLSQMHSA